MKKLIFSRRDASEIGVTMYFHNLTSMALFDQIVRLELVDGLWKNKKNSESIWESPNYYIVGEKSEVFTRFDKTDKNKYKRAFNLKRILGNESVLNKCIKLGKFVKGNEIRSIRLLSYDNLSEYLSKFPDSKDDMNNFSLVKDAIIKSYPNLKSISDDISEDDIIDFYNSSYSGKELRDDFGMIQNVMRSDPKEDEEKINDEDIEFNIPSLGLPFDFNEDDEVDEL